MLVFMSQLFLYVAVLKWTVLLIHCAALCSRSHGQLYLTDVSILSITVDISAPGALMAKALREPLITGKARKCGITGASDLHPLPSGQHCHQLDGFHRVTLPPLEQDPGQLRPDP